MSPKSIISLIISLISFYPSLSLALTTPPRIDQKVECDLLIVGGGLAGSAAAYEGLLNGKTVCLTEITDWVGGQISAQGTSALDERPTQRSLLLYPRGYLELREGIKNKYGILNPGACWVSEACFMPEAGNEILLKMLKKAEKKGKGRLHWFPSTVIKDMTITDNQITEAIAIQHQPLPGTPPLNTEPLSQIIDDAYNYNNSQRFNKTIIRFIPKIKADQGADWYIIEATETGEIIGLTNIPHQLGIDPRSPQEPTASSLTADPYCTQGFTYTFAMEATADPQTHEKPSFYEQYAPYYSYELPRLANFNLVYTYRRIHSMKPNKKRSTNPREWPIYPGDISMQNWTWGNDYRPGTSTDNLILTPAQLEATGQLEPGGWKGGLRTETLRKGEENALGFFYWLVEGTTDSQLGAGVKEKHPNYRYLSGLNSPMGTVHGLSKYPYMREGRRIIGRPSYGYKNGFMVSEIDISRNNFRQDWYSDNLTPEEYRLLWLNLGGLDSLPVLSGQETIADIQPRSRATIYADTVGIGHYAIDFHPCLTQSPPEIPGNTEREGERRGQGQAYPFQIPLRAMIPQKIDNLLVAGKSIATSHIAAAAYRVHSFEWSVGAAAGTTAAFSLEKQVFPYELVDNLPYREPLLEELQRLLESNNNPILFPGMSIFNQSWEDWK
ncbi:FAD-dependent oxidoreductase [Planktothrix sp. FACHB-1365]|uniref:FAD-dependent oxidoreductase n=1 Tax=Planktothrix sp. FACHB-1365 TaxID=2692855 RepID=UPI0016869C32|nr:FAD-dependent oxidoreductase [Planktothrix sp. FACHB-1365]MBD2482272.1 FAD-dependent oxidoreductase [Planktothrix sp. FACHB-1365]